MANSARVLCPMVVRGTFGADLYLYIPLKYMLITATLEVVSCGTSASRRWLSRCFFFWSGYQSWVVRTFVMGISLLLNDVTGRFGF